MKYELEVIPPGIVIYRVKEPLFTAECAYFIASVQKQVSSGKNRIIIEFNERSGKGEAGLVYLEKCLRSQIQLAKKLGGNLKFVAPTPLNAQVAGTSATFEDALKSLIDAGPDFVNAYQALVVQTSDQAKRLAKIAAENQILAIKLQQLLEMVSQPSTDQELQDAVTHYRILAGQHEAVQPSKLAAAAKDPSKPDTPPKT